MIKIELDISKRIIIALIISAIFFFIGYMTTPQGMLLHGGSFLWLIVSFMYFLIILLMTRLDILNILVSIIIGVMLFFLTAKIFFVDVY